MRALPNASEPMANDAGQARVPWYGWFSELWRKLGGIWSAQDGQLLFVNGETVSGATIGAGLALNRATNTLTATGGSGSGGLPEAPVDGAIYGRRNAAWTQVNASPGIPAFSVQYNNAGAFGGIRYVSTTGDNLLFLSGARLPGDFAAIITADQRPAFQSSGTNEPTTVQANPSGTNAQAAFAAVNTSTATDCSYSSVGVNATTAYFDSSRIGAGVTLPLSVRVGNTPAAAVAMTVWPTGNVRIGSTFTDPAVRLQVDSDVSVFAAASASNASIRLPHGSAPSSPVNGDTWTTTAGIFVRINGVTVGPLGAGGGGTPGGLNTQLQYNNSGAFGGITNVTANGTDLTAASIDGNLSFVGTARRIRVANSSSGTIADRLFFQDSGTNQPTSIGMIPNGSSAVSSFTVFNNSTPTNAAYTGQLIDGTYAYLDSTRVGGGTALPFVIRTGTGPTAAMSIWTNGNVRFGNTLVAPTNPFQIDGNVTFAGTTVDFSASNARIFGEFTSATISNRTSFQSRTLNGATVVQAIPNGSSTVSAWTAIGNATPTNAGYAQVVHDGTDGYFDTLAYGSGTPGTMRFRTGSAAERMSIDSNGNVAINTAALATTATNGFLYVPSCAGTPTGVPTTKTGRVPIVVDTTNNKLYFYSGGAWRDAGP
jgi:hypothetical protein